MTDIDIDYETKLLHLEIKENQEKYISGERSLEEPLKKTEELYDLAYEAARARNNNGTSNKFSHDSTLMQLQSKIVRQRAKSYKPDSLVFDPREFSEKLKRHFIRDKSSAGESKKLSNQQYSVIWQKLGEESQKTMHVVPTFDFLYGIFDAEPASPVKRKRKRIEKDKIKDAVKPKSVDISQTSDGQDIMIKRATRTLSILQGFIQKSERKSICFYEFVTDPQSFTRTIENIFSLTILLKMGCVCIFPDEQGLPCLREVGKDEKEQRQSDPSAKMQSVLSMSVEEWQAIVKKGNFKVSLLQPPKSKPRATHEKR